MQQLQQGSLTRTDHPSAVSVGVHDGQVIGETADLTLDGLPGARPPEGHPMSDQMNEPEKQPFTGIALTPERRRYPRHRVQVQLELHQEGSDVPIRLVTTDLSRNGCYVESNMTLSVGTKIEARLWLGGTGITVHGRIVTAHPQFGNGIMFLDYDGDSEQRLREFLNTLPLG
jgi:hypothetical protein